MIEPRIDELVDDLEPVQRPPSLAASLALWGLLSWASVALLVALSGPLREGSLAQLLAAPRVVLECGLGVALGLVAMAGALRLATPGLGTPARLALPAGILLAAWLAAYGAGLVSPALEPSQAGYREHCFVQVLLFSLPPLGLGLVLLRRRAALEPGVATALCALAAASLPALAMQLACAYDPLHALQMHLPPLLLLGATGALLGRWLLRRI